MVLLLAVFAPGMLLVALVVSLTVWLSKRKHRRLNG